MMKEIGLTQRKLFLGNKLFDASFQIKEHFKELFEIFRTFRDVS